MKKIIWLIVAIVGVPIIFLMVYGFMSYSSAKLVTVIYPYKAETQLEKEDEILYFKYNGKHYAAYCEEGKVPNLYPDVVPVLVFRDRFGELSFTVLHPERKEEKSFVNWLTN